MHTAHQVVLSVEELEAIREEVREEARAEAIANYTPVSVPALGFSADEIAAIREEYEDRIRLLEAERAKAVRECERLRKEDADARKAAEEILRHAYKLDQVLGKRVA